MLENNKMCGGLYILPLEAFAVRKTEPSNNSALFTHCCLSSC